MTPTDPMLNDADNGTCRSAKFLSGRFLFEEIYYEENFFSKIFLFSSPRLNQRKVF